MEAVRSQRDTPSGMLRINAAPTAARQIISPLVLEFLRRYPQMQVDIVTEGRLVDIVAAGFDLGVRVANLVPTDMISLSLGRPQRSAVVGSPEYFTRHPMPLVPTDLLGHDCIRVRLPNGALYRWHFQRGGESVRLDGLAASFSTRRAWRAPPCLTARASASSWSKAFWKTLKKAGSYAS